MTGFRNVRNVTPPGELNYEVAVTNLANALVAQFERTGDSGTLDEVITLLSQHFKSKDREAGRLYLRGWALQRQAERSGDVATIKKAVAARRRALNLIGKSNPAYPDRLSDLGGAQVQPRPAGRARARHKPPGRRAGARRGNAGRHSLQTSRHLQFPVLQPRRRGGFLREPGERRSAHTGTGLLGACLVHGAHQLARG